MIKMIEVADCDVKIAIKNTLCMIMKGKRNMDMMEREMGDTNRLKSSW